ncbi:baseplate J/gp47 family protein, partial [Anaerotruncus colihominis]
MFEEQTYEAILRRMMAAAVEGRPEVDTRTASILFSALAPAAVELTNLYITADSVLDEAFADTQSRDFLIRRCAERGMHPYPATAAVWRGQFNKTPPVGTRFSLEGLNYVLTESISETDARLECEMPGEAGNTLSGRLIPIEYVAGLTKAQLVELLIPGEDEEDTEHL